MKLRLNIKLYMLMIMIVIVGGLNYGASAWGYNIIENIFGIWGRYVYIIISLAALVLALNRNTFLPFLGRTAVPCSSIPVTTQDNTTESIKIKIKPNTKIIYWAAESGTNYTKHAMSAYNKVANYGVAISDNTGVVELKFNYPQGYYVKYWGMKKNIPPHIHYRTCDGNLMLSEVRTVMLK